MVLKVILSLGFSLFSLGGAMAQVYSPDTVPTATNGKGVFVRYLATPKHQNTKSAFIAHVTFPAGAKVAEHRDFTEEYLYFLKGSGKIWINDKVYEVKPGSLAYTPKDAKVKFEGSSAGPIEVLQVFAPSGPEKKYNGLKAVDSAKGKK